MLALQSTAANGYASLELRDTSGTSRGGFGYANASAGVYTDQVYYYASSKRLCFGAVTGSTHLCINTSGGVSIGTTSDAGANNLLVAGSVTATGGIVYGTFTVGTFPATTYLEAVVTDALAPVQGATVAAGGFAKCKVMYNGSAKIVTAVL
jgi:hypothetical protein